MSYSINNMSVRGYWHNRSLMAYDAFDQVKSYLRQLQHLSPLFSNFYVSRHQDQAVVLLEPDFANFDKEVALAVPHDRTYKNADLTDQTFSMSCRGWGGFGATFATVASNRQPGCWIAISCGSDDPGLSNRVNIYLSPELETPELLHALLDNLVLFWRPEHAAVTQHPFSKILKQPIGDADVGWLTYLSNPDAARVLPASTSYYLLADGIVVQAAERPRASDDAEYVKQLRLIHDALEPHGFLKDSLAMNASHTS